MTVAGRIASVDGRLLIKHDKNTYSSDEADCFVIRGFLSNLKFNCCKFSHQYLI